MTETRTRKERYRYLKIRVDSHMPIPVAFRTHLFIKVLRRMKAGESFRVETFKECQRVAQNARFHGMEVVTRKTSEKGWNGYRLWKL